MVSVSVFRGESSGERFAVANHQRSTAKMDLTRRVGGSGELSGSDWLTGERVIRPHKARTGPKQLRRNALSVSAAAIAGVTRQAFRTRLTP